MADLPTTQRVVEVIADLGDGRWRAGSGFLVGWDGTVLTAAHVVHQSAAVIVRDADKREYDAELDALFVADMQRCDLALVTVAGLAGRAGPVPVAAVDDAAMGWEFIRDVWAVGYPRFKALQQQDGLPPIRERAQVDGRIPPLDNNTARLLSLQVTVPPGMPPLPSDGTALGSSPWEGMSGAAVSAQQFLLGVVNDHSTIRGAGEITVTPLTFLNDDRRAPANARDWWRRLGVAAPLELPLLPSRLPGSAAARAPGSARVAEFRGRRHRADFIGRDADLRRLDELLLSPGAGPVVIYGLGGVGKSQLAVEYAHQQGTELAVRWMVRATIATAEQASPTETAEMTAGPLLTDYAGLATALGLDAADDPDLDVVAAAVRQWLATNSGWLLIIDNADHADAVTEINRLLPDASHGRIIITSRLSSWPGGYQQLMLDSLDTESASTFLLNALPGALRAGADEDARRLAEALGGLPLALTQAAAYCRETGRPLSRYLQLLRKAGPQLLATGAEPGQATVANTWRISITEVRSRNPAAATLLDLLAYFAPDVIPRSLLFEDDSDEFEVDDEVDSDRQAPSDTSDAVTDGSDTAVSVSGPLDPLNALDTELAVDEAIGLLARYSLLTISAAKDALSVHRLVQTVIRTTHSDAERVAFPRAAVDWIYGSLPAYSLDAWSAYQQLLPHAIAATTYAIDEPEPPLVAATLLRDIGVYQRERGQYAAGLDSHLRAASVAEGCLDPADPTLTYFLSALCLTLLDSGDPERALGYARRCLAIDEQVYGSEHAEVAADFQLVGRCLMQLGQYEQARSVLQRALDIAETIYGPADPEVYIPANDLGGVLVQLGQYEQARPLLQRALDLAETVFGPTHAHVAQPANNLGLALVQLGLFEQARPLLQRALDIVETSYGPTHPEIYLPANNLGLALTELGQYQQARPLLQRALDIAETVYGPTHPNVYLPANNLGTVLIQLGQYQQAQPLLQRALDIAETSFGPTHPNVYQPANNLGNVLLQLGEYQQARPLLRRALDIAETVYGPTHPNVAQPASNFGMALMELGQYEQARPLFQRALDIVETVYGPTHPNVHLPANNLGLALMELGQFEQARPLLQRALDIAEASYGPTHPHVYQPANNLGSVLLELGQPEQARPLLQRALDVVETIYGPTHPNVVGPANNLGSVLMDLGLYEQAQPVLQRALDIAESADRPVNRSTYWAAYRLGRTLLRLGKPEQARSLLQRALEIAEATQPPDHEDARWAEHWLGITLLHMGDSVEARRLLDRAVRATPPGDQAATRMLIGWANALVDLDQFEEAKALLQRCIEQGDADLEVGVALNRLALSLHAKGRTVEALPLLQQVLAIDEAALGPDHAELVTDLTALAGILHVLHRDVEAVSAYRRALLIAEGSGADPSRPLTHLTETAAELVESAPADELAVLLQSALDLATHSFGEFDLRLLEILRSLARVSQSLGDNDRAIALLERVATIHDRFGAVNAQVAQDLRMLGMALRTEGRTGQSLEQLSAALDIDRQVYGDKEIELVVDLDQIAITLELAGRSEEARGYRAYAEYLTSSYDG